MDGDGPCDGAAFAFQPSGEKKDGDHGEEELQYNSA